MKLDTSGLESTALHSGAICEPFTVFSAASSFDLPVTSDVSSNELVNKMMMLEQKFGFIEYIYWFV